MQTYLVRVAYTPEAWAAWAADPHSCAPKVGAAVAARGGSLRGFWWSFGEHDTVMLLDMPDDVAMRGLSTAFRALGGFRAFDITPLMDDATAVEAMRRASGPSHASPPRA